MLDDDSFCRFIPITESHGRGIAAIRVHPTHNTLVISKEENGQTGHGIDQNQQRPFLVVAAHIVARYAVHVDHGVGVAMARARW